MRVVLEVAVVLGSALVAALVFTPAARALARRVGAVTRPMPKRWYKGPTPLFGGVAIVAAAAAGLAAATVVVGDGWALRIETATARPALGIAISSCFMFVVGLVDDLVHLRPPTKLLLELLAGAMLLSLGAVFPVTPWDVVNVVATLFWFLALTNAFNLLDGLDGVAAGVGAIASFFLGLAFAFQGAWGHAAVAWSLAGATLGFLRYNFHPASVFMGDAGSLFLGSMLAGLVVTLPGAVSTNLVSVLFVPLVIVAVPLLDTTLVTVTRVLAGQPISEGGLDHSTYRLIALGLNERQVAVLLYALAAAGGLIALLLTRLDRGLGVLVGTAFLVAMSLFAAYLGRGQVGAAGQGARMKPLTVLVRSLFYKRRLAEILLDVALITLAYYAAFRLRFDGMLPPAYASAFEATVGPVIAVTLTLLGLFGVYRGAWEYTGIFDVYRIVGAVLVSNVTLLAYAAWRVPPLAQSHNIIYIAALVAAGLLLTSRLSFKSLELVRQRFQRKGERVLIYGADSGGELALRELLIHGELRLRPVCFVDDDARQHGREIHGVPIVAGLDGLGWVVERYKIDKIVIGTRQVKPETLAAIQVLARGRGVHVGWVNVDVKWLVPVDAAPAVRATPEPSVAAGNGRGETHLPVEVGAAGGPDGNGRIALTG